LTGSTNFNMYASTHAYMHTHVCTHTHTYTHKVWNKQGKW